jgi:menaquinone-dependent protoporphyrinogen oxidase
MRVLIAYGSERGGTEGLAEMLRDELIDAGVEAVARPASSVHDVDGYDAVVVAGALYANRWHKDARRFCSRHAGALRNREVWLVSTGPLDDSATKGEIAPVKQVADCMAKTGARGHVTIGGRLERDAKGFPASAMAKKMSGDWRDRDQVRGFARAVAQQLTHAA